MAENRKNARILPDTWDALWPDYWIERIDSPTVRRVGSIISVIAVVAILVTLFVTRFV